MPTPEPTFNDNGHITLCEALDRVLNKGAVVVGELTIAVADVDLLYLGVQLILTSIETARETMASPEMHKGGSQ